MIRGMINPLTLSNANNPIKINTIHRHIKIFSSVEDFPHRFQIFQATFLLSAQTFSAVSTVTFFALSTFFSKLVDVFVVFFSGIVIILYQ
jgi:hypothetical protein